ncbi:MAG: hypothetical protein F6K53_35695 [Moorea sp. SIO4A1]|uniref:hypothetical protein n=1 Tax=Moorena sp. SIO4A1 TaxID=2607835 RepID=UPI00144EECED|nr:hypothetical protein [Moorena sp. SIO4A1]NEQ62450.1 hypothetical protein [Moorena sp. SIO4A1]
MPNSSNTPNPNPNSPRQNFFQKLVDIISSDKLANLAKTYPLIFNLVAFSATLCTSMFLIIKNMYSDLSRPDLDEKLKIEICNNYENLVEERLEIEGYENVSLDFSPVDNKNNSHKNQLPFYCKYKITEANQNLISKELAIELNPIFTDYHNEINKDYQEKIDWKDVCSDPTITKQMKEQAKVNQWYKDGDDIIPKGAELLDEIKKDVYPVFRWVCSYEIINQQVNNESYEIISEYKIDLNLEPYCESKAKQQKTNRIKPTHHYYKDPYSLYCVDPHYKNYYKN